MKKIVIGCTGAIGQAVVNAFEECNEEVVGLSRSVKPGQIGTSFYESLDVENSFAVKNSVEQNSTVFYCANAPYHLWEDKLPAMLDGLLAGTKGKNVHIVYVDNYYGYGDQPGVLAEDSDYLATTVKGKLRAALSQQLKNYSLSNNERVSIIRAGDIYGPNMNYAVFSTRSYKQIVKGKNVDFPVKVTEPHCFNYVRDVGRALKMVDESEGESSPFNIWHVPHDGEISIEKLVELGANSAGTNSKAKRMPSWLLSIMAKFIPPLGEFREMQYEFDKTLTIKAEKFENRYDFIPTPHESAMIETINWVRGR